MIDYPSEELRDQVLATGMADGMEMSFARLEREVLPARRGGEQAAGAQPPA